jgi:hypothetical protein
VSPGTLRPDSAHPAHPGTRERLPTLGIPHDPNKCSPPVFSTLADVSAWRLSGDVPGVYVRRARVPASARCGAGRRRWLPGRVQRRYDCQLLWQVNRRCIEGQSRLFTSAALCNIKPESTSCHFRKSRFTPVQGAGMSVAADSISRGGKVPACAGPARAKRGQPWSPEPTLQPPGKRFSCSAGVTATRQDARSASWSGPGAGGLPWPRSRTYTA